MKKKLSIISPVYNESAGLEIYFAEVRKLIETEEFLPYDVEVLLVDNAVIHDIAQPKKISQICLTQSSQITLVLCALGVSGIFWAMVVSVI